MLRGIDLDAKHQSIPAPKPIYNTVGVLDARTSHWEDQSVTLSGEQLKAFIKIVKTPLGNGGQNGNNERFVAADGVFPSVLDLLGFISHRSPLTSIQDGWDIGSPESLQVSKTRPGRWNLFFPASGKS